jgi:glycosyltransferase involved in cell wall biosynthesis
MSKISVYIIAYNQASKIEAAINSVLWADEVVLVDSNSTDGTTKLAEKMGARVIQAPFQGFGDLRNQAVSACRYDWIFSLDSDERCTTEVENEILTIINSTDACDIYKVPRKNYFMGRWIKHGDWYPDYRQPQLFRKGCLSYANDLVHESYHCHSDKPVGYLKNAIWQVPFQDLTEMMDKANRYSTLGVDRLRKKYNKASMSLAITHMIWTFIRIYILKRGFLDGFPGFIIAMGYSYGTFYRYAKFYEQQKT